MKSFSGNATTGYTPTPEFLAKQEIVLADMQRIVDGFPLSIFQAAPVSPLFQPGGQLEDFPEDITLFVIGFILCFIIDYGLVQRVIHPKGRYFALHAIINAIVVYFCFEELMDVIFNDPVLSFFGPMRTMVPNSFVCAMHTYHCVAWWNELTGEDIFHHVTFAFALTLMAVPVKRVAGASSNFGAFFLSGLPGGMDYVMMVMNYHGLMTREQEKRVNKFINLYLRAPGTIIYVFCGWHAWLNPGLNTLRGVPPSPLFYLLAFAGAILFFYNGQYYAAQSVESHQVYQLKNEKKATTKTDTKLTTEKKEK